ncbi:MAG: UxaA family hydrolase [Terriglobales bacterium]
MKKAFRIHESDNVATLLADAAEEHIQIIGACVDYPIYCCEPVCFGHKVAVLDISMNSDVVKYGVVIGTATEAIRTGQWVHLHNCRSQLDERSGTLDLHTGSSKDVVYE